MISSGAFEDGAHRIKRLNWLNLIQRVNKIVSQNLINSVSHFIFILKIYEKKLIIVKVTEPWKVQKFLLNSK